MHDGERCGELKRKKGQKITMRMRAYRTNALDGKDGQMRRAAKKKGRCDANNTGKMKNKIGIKATGT